MNKYDSIPNFHIEKLSENSYRFVVELPRNSKTGKRQRKVQGGFKTKRDATTAAKQYINRFITGDIEQSAPVFYRDFLSVWYDEQIASATKYNHNTAENYRKVIENHLAPSLGGYLITALNYNVLQDYLDSLSKQGYKKTTISNIKAVLTSSLKYAVKRNIIQSNPSTELEINVFKKTAKTKKHSTQIKNDYIPPENIELLFERFPEGNPNHIPLILGYRCGMRSGEIYGLSWNDVDFEAKKLTVRQQLQYDSGQKRWIITPPKYNSIRTIGLDKITLDALKKEKERQEKNEKEYVEHGKKYVHPTLIEEEIDDENKIYIVRKDSSGDEKANFVIRKENGAFKSSNTRQHIADVAHNKLGIPFTLHSLRHTHATILANSGFEPLYTMKRLGHKNYATTMKYYVHLDEKTVDKGQPMLEDVFGNNDIIEY